ncbi:sulfotransferase family 2 domain-containing protein [Rhodalgimonas zhirmunskyi]|uniref:Sulfotransferase family protein n=1 Tax=Rhodalgimonas zhirmunskyi TaxID=2964767 RepID=A0AAJ1U8Z4_9RHOB|nr:sulfotransferase family 2 domain-containing protein [Rhodoalgimonas zhirmunskyi]MDQ2095521.1 sulfotransferase family protein [Rhodoalgimonas zhirmunskyi]
MILSRGRRYIFIHIPKTGGTAMALALESRAMKDDVMLGDTPKARNRRHKAQTAQSHGRLWKHSTLTDIAGLATPEEIASFFTFTLVRNPWDRVVSYYHWLRAQSFAHPAVTIAQESDFKTFLYHPMIGQTLRSNPYASYLTDPTGQERASLFIRLEHFDEDSAPLWDHLGFRLDLGHANTSDRVRDYRRYYSDADSQHLAQICAEDIARFGYCFEF